MVGKAPVVNLVTHMRRGPGRRLVLNGHLDTFPIGEAPWTHPPLGGDLEDGRIYGRGACDMKAGVDGARARVRHPGGVPGGLARRAGARARRRQGDRGRWGKQYLLATVEEAVGDAAAKGLETIIATHRDGTPAEVRSVHRTSGA